jgi:PTS system nitrogen regulatory IIA component
MLVSDIISQSLVKTLSNISSKKRLFQEISACLSESCSLSLDTILSALQDREQLGPTGMGNGIAIPHAKIVGLHSITGMFVRLEKPIDFDSIDKQKVDIVFAILAPNINGVDHLKALAKISRVLRDQRICSKLRSTEDNTALYSILTQDWDTKAA